MGPAHAGITLPGPIGPDLPDIPPLPDLSDIPQAPDTRPPANGFTYAVNASNDALFTINLATGKTTLVGTAGLGIGATALSQPIGAVPGALLTTSDGTLVGSDISGNLFDIALDGTVSNFRSTGGRPVQGLGGRAVPEPANLVLLGLGSLALAGRRRPWPTTARHPNQQTAGGPLR